MVKSYYLDLTERLKDPSYALEYLNACLGDEPQVFLAGLKFVAEAQIGSLSKLATLTELNRENLYRMLSEKGNPEFKSLLKLLNTLGLQFDLKLRKTKKSNPARIKVRKSRRASSAKK